MRSVLRTRSSASGPSDSGDLSHRRRFVLTGGVVVALAALAVFLSVSAALAVTVVVKPTAMDGWNFQTFGTGAGGFETGPGVPPMGAGSAELKVGSDTGGIDRADLRNKNYHGTLLSTLTEITYWTYITANSGCVAPYVLLSVDVDADGVFNPGGGIDDGLFFEPCYQTGTYVTDPPSQVIPVQNGGVVATGTWQKWDALNGGWWSNNYGGAGGPPLTTMPAYLARLASLGYANPKIANTDNCLGGVRLRVGPGPPVWNNFEGNVDDFRIGVSGNTTINDFEYEPQPIPPCNPTTPSPTVGPATATPNPVGGEVDVLMNEGAPRSATSDSAASDTWLAVIGVVGATLAAASWFAWRRVKQGAQRN